MQARHFKRRRRRVAGFSLIDMMITISLMALIGSAIGFSALEAYRRMQLKAAAEECRTIRAAVQAAKLEGELAPSACPSVEGLVERGILDEDQRTTDPWDQPYEITCRGTRILVASVGPDGEADTEDDRTSRHERRDD